MEQTQEEKVAERKAEIAEGNKNDGLDEMLKVDLQAKAAHIEGIVGEGNMTKAELVEAIRANR